MAGGRPSKYDESFKEIAENYLAEGKSIVQLARHLNVSKSTIYKWAEENKEFSDTLSIGREFSQAFWEEKLEEMMYNREVNSPLVKLYFANRFGWSDKTETKNEHSTVEKTRSFSEMYSKKEPKKDQ